MDDQAFKYRSLDDWFNTAQGRRLAIAFTSEVANISDKLSGNTLLQLGSCGDNLWLSPLRFKQKLIATPYLDKKKSTFTASLKGLPIDRNSVDCVVAPLTMEAFTRDKNPINEMDRILKPLGYVIFFGINPISFWGGGALRLRRLACFGHSSASLTSSISIIHTMSSHGYQQCFHNSFYYIPPVKSEHLIRKFEFFNVMGKMIWPFPPGFYFLVLQKFQYPSPSFLVLDERRVVEPSISACFR